MLFDTLTGLTEVDGGAGNDLITFDSGDIVSGGVRSDELAAYPAPGGESSIITDFNPDEDSLMLRVYDRADSVTLKVVDDSTNIVMEGVVEGQTDLKVSYLLDACDRNSAVVNANDDPISRDDVDIVIANYPNIST